MSFRKNVIDLEKQIEKLKETSAFRDSPYEKGEVFTVRGFSTGPFDSELPDGLLTVESKEFIAAHARESGTRNPCSIKPGDRCHYASACSAWDSFQHKVVTREFIQYWHRMSNGCK